MSSNRGKQILDENPKLPTIKPPLPHTKPKPFTPNWLDLPRDITLHIFLKLGLYHLLCNAQFVCSLWHQIARDPILYRRIHILSRSADMGEPLCHFVKNAAPLAEMLMEVINRSCGQLDEFSLMYNATDQMLLRMVETSCRLKRLCLARCFEVSEGVLVEVVTKMASLETFELRMCLFPTEVIEAVGRACPGLKSFRLNQHRSVFREVQDKFDGEALAIADTMPGLRSLHLFGNRMSNTGLHAILDKCLHLEYLDLRKCSNVDMDGDLLKKCHHIKMLNLPTDSTQDYEYEFDLDDVPYNDVSDFPCDDDRFVDYDQIGDYESNDFAYDDFTEDEDYSLWGKIQMMTPILAIRNFTKRIFDYEK